MNILSKTLIILYYILGSLDPAALVRLVCFELSATELDFERPLLIFIESANFHKKINDHHKTWLKNTDPWLETNREIPYITKARLS